MNQPHLPWYAWLGLAVVLLTQGTWLFLDARRRGTYPWFWGIWGLIQFPVPILLYWYFVLRKQRA